MSDSKVHELLTTLRDVRLELEALKRMFFEHRPAFVDAFDRHRAALEGSGYLQALDEAIGKVQAKLG